MADPTGARAATFLFTDMEGSTRLFKRLREDYGGVLAQHQRLLREAFASHGGQEVDTQGDAFFVTFARVRDAVLAAAAAQRALAAYEWPEDVDVRVRIGVHTGEAAVDENRYVGVSVHRAARICAAARGGQILISQTTRHMLEDEEAPLPGIELRDLGERALKDLERPVHLSEVLVTETKPPRATATRARARATAQRSVLPGALSLVSPFPFVGRSRQLATLRSLLPGADGEGRRVVLLSGDAGSGKTRILRELAQEAARDGALVLYGTSDAVVTTPYQPFVESLQFLQRVLDPAEFDECVGAGGSDVARLVPDVAARLPPSPATAQGDPDTERHRLHTSVAELLRRAAQRRPLLVVLDDAHWADASSLHLLRFLARTGADARVLFVAAFREREPDIGLEFADTLADLVRVEGVARLQLEPLESEDVTEFVRRSGDAEPGPQLAALGAEIGELTGGNAFLLCELWRSLVETGSVDISEGVVRLTRPITELGSPETVRHVVQSRLTRLAPETTALLELAAVVGAQFELSVLREAAGQHETVVVSALDEAVRSGTIEEVPGVRLAHRFTHELVRRALADRLTWARRAELHLRVAEALERVYGDPAPVLTDLAHHFTVAAPVGGADRAVDYNLRAADAALASLAFEEAAARLSTALDLGINDESERMRIQLELGNARHRAGQPLEALNAFQAAADLARKRGDGETLARAAIGLEETCWRPAIVDEGAVELAREAIEALGDGDSALRARLLGALSRALVFAGSAEEAAVVREAAIAMARRVRDPATLANLLSQAYFAIGKIPLGDVLAMLTEGRQLAAELGNTVIECETIAWSIVAHVAMCNLDTARRELDLHTQLAERTREPFHLYFSAQVGSAIALCDGRLDEAEAMAERSLEWAGHLRGRVPPAVHGMQLFGIRREQGRLAELRPVVQALVGPNKSGWAWRPGLVALFVELGMEKEARAELEEMRADEFAGVVRDFSAPSLAYLTDACAAIGDVESAPLLYRALKPLAGSNVVIGQLGACYGAADRYLGMLAATMSDWDQAEAHFEYALYLNRRMGAHTWTARTAYEYARMLLSRDAAGDRRRAGELLADAAASAERFGLRALEGKVRALGPVEARPPALPDDLSAREVEVLQLIARGHSNREIGAQLFISEHTAANHVRSILRKTGCANRTDAASYAHRNGLVSELSRR